MGKRQVKEEDRWHQRVAIFVKCKRMRHSDAMTVNEWFHLLVLGLSSGGRFVFVLSLQRLAHYHAVIQAESVRTKILSMRLIVFTDEIPKSLNQMRESTNGSVHVTWTVKEAQKMWVGSQCSRRTSLNQDFRITLSLPESIRLTASLFLSAAREGFMMPMTVCKIVFCGRFRLLLWTMEGGRKKDCQLPGS